MNKESLNFKINYFLVIMISFIVITIVLFGFFLQKTNKEIKKIKNQDLTFLRETSNFEGNIHNIYYLINNYNTDHINFNEDIKVTLNLLNNSLQYFSNQNLDENSIKILKKSLNSLNNNITTYLEFYDPIKEMEALDIYNKLKNENINNIFSLILNFEKTSSNSAVYLNSEFSNIVNSLKLHLNYDIESVNTFNVSYDNILNYLNNNNIEGSAKFLDVFENFHKESMIFFTAFDISKRIQAKNYLEEINILLNKELSSTLNKSTNQTSNISNNFNSLLKLQKISYFIFILCLVFLLILILLHTFYLNKNLLKNLNHIKKKIVDINSGESTIYNHIVINSKDELAEIANNFNNFEDKLHKLILKIKTGAFSIQQSVEILNTYNDNLVKKSDAQHSKIELINSNLSEVKKTISFNNENTLKLNKLAKKTKKITEIISLEAKSLSDTIGVIFKSSEKIEKISTSIEELSFQTTILSLNSAVESTRVQTGAKSFDVISNEIHKLSTMGKNAAKEIKNLSNENKIKIDESAFYLKNTVKLIETIVIKINEISILLDDITQGSKIETEGISNILSSLYDIELSTQHTNTIAKDTLSLSENLNNEALTFLDIIGYFDKTINPIKNTPTEELKNVLSDEEKENISNVLGNKNTEVPPSIETNLVLNTIKNPVNEKNE